MKGARNQKSTYIIVVFYQKTKKETKKASKDALDKGQLG